MTEFYKKFLQSITFSIKHILIVKSDCYGNLSELCGFLFIISEKNYIEQLKHERGLYLRHIQRH